MGRAWVACVFLLLPALARATELPPARRATRAAPTPSGPDLFGGYSHSRSGEAGLNGWHLSASAPLRGSLRLVADLSGHYGSFAGANLSQVTFLAGARLVWNRDRRIRPFGEALAGGAHTTSSIDVPGASIRVSNTGWGGALGGGVDYRLSHRWALRGQGELLLLRSGGAWERDPRLSAGLAYRFGH